MKKQHSLYLKNNFYFCKKNAYWVILFLFILTFKVNGQEVWTKVKAPFYSISPINQKFGENYYILNDLSPQPVGKSYNLTTGKKTFILPNEKGQMETFSIVYVPLLSDALSRRFPNIKTYEGQSISRPKVRVRLSTHPNGVNAWLKLTEGPDFFIQTQKGQKNVHFTYLKSKVDFISSLSCKTEDLLLKNKVQNQSNKLISSNNVIKTFRIAIATTGEYTSFWGDDDDSNGTNVQDAFGALVSSLNRISSVFEDEVKVRLKLVSDERLIYDDKNTDPFTGNFAEELQTNLDEVIGDSNYDIGHLFDYGSSADGAAGCIGCVCESGRKGKGYSTHPFKDVYGGEYRNDYFDLDYAGHEIGHQFGAYHTFSHVEEGHIFNAEPGSGSTIMCYAGITGEDDVQFHGDSYFHYHSIQNILNNVAQKSCSTNELLETQVFTTNAGSDYYIPVGTAYELSAKQVEDVDGTTYCWEQLDDGKVTSDSFGPNNISGSMTRSLPPTVNPFRTIPNLERLTSNNLTQEKPNKNDAWETVSLVSRVMQWGLTVRKPFENLILVAQDKVKLTVDASAGPFIVTSQDDSNIVLKGGSREKITWNVANTDEPPFNTSKVSIYLSIDGGETFSIELDTSIPNSGKAEVLIPNTIDTDKARIKIKADDGIFFALNKVNFSIESRDIIIKFNSYLLENCTSDSVQYDFTILRSDGFNESFTPTIDGLPSGVQVEFSKNKFTKEDSSGYFIINGLNGLIPSDYNLFLNIILSTQSENFLFILKKRNKNNNPAQLISPVDNAKAQDINLQFDWEVDANVDSSRLQVSLSDSFNSFIKDTVLTKNQFLLKNLDSNTTFYWRVQNQNICNDSNFSNIFSFKTSKISCIEESSTSVPKILIDATDDEDGVTSASIEINYDLPILDIDILVDIEHSWVGDLVLYLESPGGTLYLLSNRLGDSNDNYTQTIFDQEAFTSILEASVPFTGSYQPFEDISRLYGSSSFGTWKLIVKDQSVEDTGKLIEFKINFCVQGVPLPNNDDDSIVDLNDNCPSITNESQDDIDNNGIGDVCDVFSSQNITLTKMNTSCPEKDNGSLAFDARAEYNYIASISGPNGFQSKLLFSSQGRKLQNLAAGNYDICIRTNSFPDFEYCFETQINAPLPLDVQALLNPSTSILDLNLIGSDFFNVTINDQTKVFSKDEKVEFLLTQKTNYVKVTTNNSCQGLYEKWINLGENSKIFPNPVTNLATLILPRDRSAEISLYSGAGDLIWQEQHEEQSNEVVLIPMNQFQAGWYLVRIDYDSYSETLKVLKQ